MTREIPYGSLKKTDLYVDAVYKGGTQGTVADDPIQQILPVGNQGGFRYSGGIKTGIRLCVLYSTLSDSDWPDTFIPELGRFVYFGDNKTPGHELDHTPKKGNLILRQSFASLHKGMRDDVPPFLVFTKTGTGRDVKFRGLAVPGVPGISSAEDDLVAIWRTKEGERFQNYRATFTILDVPTVPRKWLKSLTGGEQFPAPAEWENWVARGRYAPLLAPLVSRYRTRQEQLPTADHDISMLRRICDYFDGHPEGRYGFEKCAAELVKRMDTNIMSLDLTRPWRDGGRDGTGTYRIGGSRTYLSVEFALEAKCKAPGSGSGIRETSRLVSRLRHRQFGVFVTTSYVNNQAYKELVEDDHPVLVIAGTDIIDILRAEGIDTLSGLNDWLSSTAPMAAPSEQ